MINKIHFIKYLAVLLFSLSLSAQQVSVSTTNVEYTNTGQSTQYIGCGNFNLASSTSTSIEMRINIGTYQSVINDSESNLYIYTKKSFSAIETERYSKTIPSTNWIRGSGSTATVRTYETPVTFSINAADFNATGGTLYVVFVSPSGTRYTSACTFTITKTPPPSFSISPESVSLSCGEVTGRTFTVTPANIPAGVTPSYSWSFPGWTEVGSTATSKTLQPNSGSILPSPISVTQYINVVPTEIKTSTISRSPIAASGTISGNNTVCTTGTYTFTGLMPGQSVTWSLSNATAGTLSTTTGTSTIFTATGGGSVDLIATVSDSCWGSYVKTISLFVGSPPAFSMSYDLFENQYCDTKYHQVPFIFNIPAGSSLSIQYKYPNASYTVTSLGNNKYRYTFAFSKNYSGSFNLMASITNSCGSSYFETEEGYYIRSCAQIGANSNLLQDDLENKFAVFPNPAKDIVTIELKDKENQTEKNTTISGELFDMMGQSKSKVQIFDNKATFSVRALKEGIYILKIYIDGQVENHRIAVE